MAGEPADPPEPAGRPGMNGTPGTNGTPVTNGSGWLDRAAQSSVRSVEAVAGVYATEYAIYGTVLVSALIAVGWNYDTDLEVFFFTLGTVGVFWLAHIYSAVVATHGSTEAARRKLWALVLDAARHSIGMVLAMLVPALFLLLSAAGVLDEYVGYYLALWAGVLTLAALGFWNSVKRRRGWPRRILNAAITASLGVGIIWLSYLVH